MKTIKIKDIVIDAGTQQREKINDEIVAEYSEAMKCGDQFPAVTVFFNSVEYYLADGFHRYFACKSADIEEIPAEIHEGTKRDAILYSFSANGTHGIRRTNSDKRKSVMGMLNDEIWTDWSNREIAKHVGVSPGFVDKLRHELNSRVPTVGSPVVKPAPVLEEENEIIENQPEETEEFDPTEHELQEAHDTINHLAEENNKLRDSLAAGQLPEDEIVSAEQTMIDLRKQVKNLEAELDAVKSSRDIYQRENEELKKQCKMYEGKLKKLGAGNAKS